MCCLFNLYIEKTETKRDYKKFVKLITRSMILSSFAKLFVIPLVIWNPIDIYFSLARLFTYLSNLQAITGKLF